MRGVNEHQIRLRTACGCEKNVWIDIHLAYSIINRRGKYIAALANRRYSVVEKPLEPTDKRGYRTFEWRGEWADCFKTIPLLEEVLE